MVKWVFTYSLALIRWIITQKLDKELWHSTIINVNMTISNNRMLATHFKFLRIHMAACQHIQIYWINSMHSPLQLLWGIYWYLYLWSFDPCGYSLLIKDLAVEFNNFLIKFNNAKLHKGIEHIQTDLTRVMHEHSLNGLTQSDLKFLGVTVQEKIWYVGAMSHSLLYGTIAANNYLHLQIAAIF